MKINWFSLVGLALVVIGAVFGAVFKIPQALLISIVMAVVGAIVAIFGAIKDYKGTKDWKFWLTVGLITAGSACAAIGGIAGEVIVSVVGAVILVVGIIIGAIFITKKV